MLFGVYGADGAVTSPLDETAQMRMRLMLVSERLSARVKLAEIRPDRAKAKDRGNLSSIM
jgi:hypothetical protein